MLSLATARALRAAGLRWSPASGDRFVIADRDMDDEVFVLSDMTIEAHDFPTGRVLGFNGTTEWALDSVAVEQALWLPREDQLRRALGPSFLGLRPVPTGVEVGIRTPSAGGGETWVAADDVEEAYARALLELLPAPAEVSSST
ncbi:MAG: pilus assembly protein CpaE [Actinomycetes bacterium]